MAVRKVGFDFKNFYLLFSFVDIVDFYALCFALAFSAGHRADSVPD